MAYLTNFFKSVILLEVKASNIISGDKLPDLIKSGITD
jgi:hypothetical protein